MTHLKWRHVLWSGREPTWSSIEVGFREWCLWRVCTNVLQKGELLPCTKIGYGFSCLKECFLTLKLSINFTSHLKSSKKRNKKGNFLKQQQLLKQQAVQIKQAKHIATIKYIYISSQTAEFHPLLRVSRDHSILQP